MKYRFKLFPHLYFWLTQEAERSLQTMGKREFRGAVPIAVSNLVSKKLDAFDRVVNSRLTEKQPSRPKVNSAVNTKYCIYRVAITASVTVKQHFCEFLQAKVSK